MGTSRPLLAPDVVLQVRATARCWNAGEKYEPFGEFFFSLLKIDQFVEKGRDIVTMQKKNMFRNWVRKFGIWPLTNGRTHGPGDENNFEGELEDLEDLEDERHNDVEETMEQ